MIALVSPFKIAILISGSGTNMENIINYFKNSSYIKIACVISDRENALGLQKARKSGIKEIHYIPPGKFKTKLEGAAEQAYIAFLKKLNVDLIVLSGFMRVLKRPFLEAFPKKIINLHPSLLPKYPGLNTFNRILESKEKITGSTIHFVEEKVDVGEIIAQRRVHVFDNDTITSLSNRVKKMEWELYPKTIERLALQRNI